jgi:hypothetical protein
MRPSNRVGLMKGCLLTAVPLWLWSCSGCDAGSGTASSETESSVTSGSSGPVCSDCYPGGFRITPTPVLVSTDPPPAVLFSGWRNGWCREDVICTGTPDVDLGDLKHQKFRKNCKEEVVLFGGGVEPTPASIADPFAAGMTVTLKPARDLPITVWIVQNVLTESVVKSEVGTTRSLFITLGTGLVITATVKPFPPLPDNLRDLDSWASCTLAPTLAASAANGMYDPDRINVYYIRGFSPAAGSPMALTCFGGPSSHPEIIFVDGDIAAAPYTLAHELGHALGLQRSSIVPATGGSTYPGHVNELELDLYLRSDNLMRSGSTFVGQITVGQIYRMHFDKLSWLWHNPYTPGTYPRECQNSPVTGGNCPPLAIQPPGGWP